MKADIRIIANGGAKGMTEQSARDEFVATVQRALPNASVVFTSKDVRVEKLVKDALDDEITTIVAAGGDGTVNAVASILVDTPNTLGVVPLGTLNHFAKDLGIPDDIEGALAVLAIGNIARIDVGKVNDRYFVNNSGLGLYPEMVFNREEQQRHGVSKWSAALVESVRAFKRYRMLKIEIEMDGTRLKRKTPAVFIGNNEYEFSPASPRNRSTLTAGTLSLYVPHPRSRMKLVWFAVRAFFGNPKADGEFDRFLANQFTITTADKPLYISLDGEVENGRSPLKFESRAGVLGVLVPVDSPTVRGSLSMRR
ncbi:MAG: diacylglycerol kinase family protein [Gemmatimonadaceae bacterium]